MMIAGVWMSFTRSALINNSGGTVANSVSAYSILLTDCFVTNNIGNDLPEFYSSTGGTVSITQSTIVDVQSCVAQGIIFYLLSSIFYLPFHILGSRGVLIYTSQHNIW